ncbi:MAG: FSR family fosmidomycin resistance protein-like MFS transporter [Alphaproteobacteria bacterium]|jgi:FSR family fosmidomycin resistance protein-like MFS transporter
MADTAIAGSFRQEAEVVGLVSGGHFMSHYYSMMLPPLFPFLHDDLGVSYTMLGLLLSLKHLAGGATQLPAGILVDKYGARSILMVGFAIIVGAYFVIAVTTSFWILALMLIFAGCGNAVFHPADYSIINGTITETRLGRSFSFHTFAGHLGSAVAPVVLLTMTAFWSWRTGVLTSVIVGLVIILALATRWSKMQEGVTKRMSTKGKKQVENLSADTAEEPIVEAPKDPSTWELLLHIMKSPAVIFLFIFFAMQSLGSGGLRAFSVSALVTLHGTPAAAAGGALTGFLFASALGVLAGGVVADKNNRHDLVAGGALLLTALICVLVAKINLHYALLVFVFTLAGLIQGIIRPARDMMIRAATPKGSMGKVVGLVFSGQAIGGAVAPVAYGFLIDIGSPEMVFYSSGVFMVLCAGAVYGSYRDSRNKAAAGISA